MVSLNDINVLIIDNHDSFTYNIIQLIKQYHCRYTVIKNTEITFDIIKNYTHILISPGPGLPTETINIKEIIKTYYATHSILGICLGHQAIAECFGTSLIQLTKPAHGIETEIKLDLSEPLFKNLPVKINVGRYHSWVIKNSSLNKDFKITAKTADNIIMAISHKMYKLKGIQFHPESIITQHGNNIIKNWLTIV
ncbi:MAG TPA: aminodeoxychorismate/anthranilate synthase component II [Bacteroidales bacterium]|nr:aminodeoxychorismate/anthranilate synthase component II [Bacteroidales bacterium]